MKKIILLTLFFSSSLYCAEEAPKYGKGLSTELLSESIVPVVRHILQNRLAETSYDRIYASEQFIHYFLNLQKENKEVTIKEAYESFSFDPDSAKSRGGPCVFLTLDLLNHLPTEFNAYVVAAKLPSKYQQPYFPLFCHTAIVISCSDGYLLLDPSFDIAEPVFLSYADNSFEYDMGKKGTWNFSLEENEIICQIIPLTGPVETSDPDYLRMHYRLDQLLNPIESSATPMIAADRRLSFLSRRNDGSHLAHLNIELNKERIVWDQDDVLMEPISFKEFALTSFPESFCEKLYTTQEELYKRISFILENRSILDDLFEYRKAK